MRPAARQRRPPAAPDGHDAAPRCATPKWPSALSPAVATSAATAGHPAREDGITSAFQIPPSPRTVSGSDSSPSARAAKASTPRGSLSGRAAVQRTRHDPGRVDGEGAQQPRGASASVPPGHDPPRTPVRRRRPSLRPQRSTAARASHSTMAGIAGSPVPGAACCVVQPGQRRVGEEQWPVPDPEALGHVGIPDVEGGGRELRRQVVRRHESSRTRSGQHQCEEEQQPSPAPARAPARRGGRPRRPTARPAGAPSPVPGSRSGRRGRGRRPCRSSGRTPAGAPAPG